MTGDEFWALIDATRPAEPDPDVHAQAMTRALAAAGVGATVAFQRHFDAAHDALYRWDVWGVVYLLRGGCSDDSFDYARAWVVGEGRSTWERVAADPEAWAAALVDEVVATGEEVSEGLQERGFDDAEPLLYAAGTAHEQLTGEWTPVDPDRVVGEPAGEEWDEGAVEAAFPRLTAALASAGAPGADSEGPWVQTVSQTIDVAGGGVLTLEEWVADGSDPAVAPPSTGPGVPSGKTREISADDLPAILAAVDAAEEHWEEGDQAAVAADLAPVLDDPARRAVVFAVLPPDLVTDLVYRGGISRLQTGDPDGAAEWLRLVVDLGEDDGRVRRGLAQVEMSRGELDLAEQTLDSGPDAAPMELAIATSLAGYRGDRAEVERLGRVTYEVIDRLRDDLHPWDIAGMNVLVGFALVDVGDGERALVAASNAIDLTHDAPAQVPLVAQGRVLAGAASRLLGNLDDADAALSSAFDLLEDGTCDKGMAEREVARCYRVNGLEDEAQRWFGSAVATFRAAAERFLASATEREAAAS